MTRTRGPPSHGPKPATRTGPEASSCVRPPPLLPGPQCGPPPPPPRSGIPVAFWVTGVLSGRSRPHADRARSRLVTPSRPGGAAGPPGRPRLRRLPWRRRRRQRPGRRDLAGRRPPGLSESTSCCAGACARRARERASVRFSFWRSRRRKRGRGAAARSLPGQGCHGLMAGIKCRTVTESHGEEGGLVTRVVRKVNSISVELDAAPACLPTSLPRASESWTTRLAGAGP